MSVDDDELYSALKGHGPREAPLSENHYINMWSRGFFQTTMALAVGLLTCSISIGLVYMSYYWTFVQGATLDEKMHNIWDKGIWVNIVFLIPLFSWGFYQFTYKRLFVQFRHYSYDILLGREWLMARGIWGQMKRIRYDDLARISEPVSFLGVVTSDMIFRSRSDPGYYIRVNGALNRFGQMVERVIAKCNETGTEYDVVYVNSVALNAEIWQKKPDWELIQNAIAQAKANRLRHGVAVDDSRPNRPPRQGRRKETG